MVALLIGVSSSASWAGGRYQCEQGIQELVESKVFFEFNTTDLDLGIQFFWDGPAWKWMKVKNQKGQKVLNVFSRGNVKRLGLTEGFFESAEPGLCPLPDSEGCELDDDIIQEAIQDFKDRFPEGIYTFKGMTTDGCLLVCDAELTNNLLAPVELDIEFPTIEWNSVPGAVAVEIVVELVVNPDEDDEQVFKETATFPGDVTMYDVSMEFQDLIVRAGENIELKVEVVIDEASGNRIITEEEVELEDD